MQKKEEDEEKNRHFWLPCRQSNMTIKWPKFPDMPEKLLRVFVEWRSGLDFDKEGEVIVVFDQGTLHCRHIENP